MLPRVLRLATSTFLALKNGWMVLVHLCTTAVYGCAVWLRRLVLRAPAARPPASALTKIPPSERGFTLVELMYALGFFTFGLLGVTSLQLTAMNGQQRVADITVASHITSSVLEELRVTPFADLTGTTESFYNKRGGQVASASYFRASWAATPDPSGDFTDVTVTTTWKASSREWDLNTLAGDPTEHQIEMRTRIFRRIFSGP